MTSNRDLFLEMQQEAAAQERSRIVREKYQQLQYLEIYSKQSLTTKNKNDGDKRNIQRNEEGTNPRR